MNLLLWIVFGALVGWVASLIMRTDEEQGAGLNMVVGIVGALVGGWIMSALGYGGVSGFNIYSFLVSLLGAIVLIGLVKALSSGTPVHRGGYPHDWDTDDERHRDDTRKM